LTNSTNASGKPKRHYKEVKPKLSKHCLYKTIKFIQFNIKTFNPLVFATNGGMAPESTKDWLKK